MSIYSILLASQRLILVSLPTWLLWCAIISFAAPYRPDGFMLMLFMVSVPLLYLGCIWAVLPFSPMQIWMPWRLLGSALVGLLPFVLIMMIGHHLGLATKVWLS